MQVRLPIMLGDPQTSKDGGLDNFEEFTTRDEDFFLDGPVSRRVAVIDLDPETGGIFPGSRLVPPRGRRKFGRYEIPKEEGIYGREFQQVSAFATVLGTMYLFEEPDSLGRRLKWAFDAPQLLIVPRAGEMANAFYERESHSLQLFYISRGDEPAVYSCLSPDIIAHETAHAILDGIAPDLYNALTPQSLALHEAIADLTALLMSLRSPKLCQAALKSTNGLIADVNALSTIAPEFGQARDPTGTARYLRSLHNKKTLQRSDRSLDENGIPNRVNRYEPHSLSEALTGAFYAVLAKLHRSMKTGTSYSSAVKALRIASKWFQQTILRALDYLPPGEVSFLDYGKAVLAVDQMIQAESQEAEWIREEFTHRGIVSDSSAFNMLTNFRFKPLEKIDLRAIASSDWVAYSFVNKHRDFFGIPAQEQFRVLPRLETTKLYQQSKNKAPVPVRELILKVSWSRPEDANSGAPFAGNRSLTVGVTLAIDWETRKVRARIDSDRIPRNVVESQVKTPATTTRSHTLHVSDQTAIERPELSASMVSSPPIPPRGVDAGAFYDLLSYRRR